MGPGMHPHPQERDPHPYVQVWVLAGTGAGGQKFAWGWPVIITKLDLQALALAAQTTESCTNPNCKAKKHSTHTTANCYWPGGGKEGQFPLNFGQRNQANAATGTATPTATTQTATPNQTETFTLSAWILDTSGQSGVLIDDSIPTALISKGFQNFRKGKVSTFMDSGASDTMFVSWDAFSEYKPVPHHVGDLAKAEGGDFEIVGEGSVVQCYQGVADYLYPHAAYAHTECKLGLN